MQGLEGASVELLAPQFKCALRERTPVSALRWDATAFRLIPVVIIRPLFWITSSLSRCDEDTWVNQMGWSSWGWGAQWPCMWPPMFRSWNLSLTQQGLSWHWEPSKPARHNCGREGQRWSGCPAWHLGFQGFCSTEPPRRQFTPEGGVGTGGCRRWTVSCWISGEQRSSSLKAGSKGAAGLSPRWGVTQHWEST